MAQTPSLTSALPDRSGQAGDSSSIPMLPPTAKPPKSKTQAYYSIHPLWTNITPIPQLDLELQATYTSGSKTFPTEAAEKLATAGPALATIAYTPRYVEAMSYLRAVMADVEYSERALTLTEDIISMNPAHYTVWIYRFRVLRELWGPLWTDTSDGAMLNEKAKVAFEGELTWLERISEKNLKNYQIWHHRNSLFQLLPLHPAPSATPWVTSLLDNEPSFLRSILALDTKNYHVWSYRQWLCAHFASHYLVNNTKELEAVNEMIDEDVMNNSTWNHRYFIVFGAKRVIADERKIAAASSPKQETDEVIDLDVVDHELHYVQQKIRISPQNGSSWNYLKGILKYASIPISDMKAFCAEFVGDGFDFEADHKSDEKKGVRSSQAVEMCVAAFADEAVDSDQRKSEEGREEAKEKVRQALKALAVKWDPIRKKYWAWRLDGYEKVWAG